MFSGSNELLWIEPTEFRFVFEENKSIRCSVKLTNRTDKYIAFKIKAKVPEHLIYHLSNTGIVPPRSTHDLIVTLRARTEVPTDSDKMFFMQSAAVREGTKINEITRDKFEKNSGIAVDELWLKAVHVRPPQPPPHVQTIAREGSSSRPLQSDVGNLNYTGSTLHRMSLQKLKDITDNFCDKRIIGRGGFGVVYKGVLENGKMVAVKKLLQSMQNSQEDSEKEIVLLMNLTHTNIVRLLGYCYEIQYTHVLHDGKRVLAANSECMLCLEYLPNGSLDKYISEAHSGLDWSTRRKIIEGVSYGLKYLHEQSNGPLVHLDLKPANILLDERMLPKITDFGLSRLFDQTKTVTLIAKGTLGYMPPEFIQGIITSKWDIFSLGVIIMEVITGHRDYPFDLTTYPTEFIKLELGKWREVLQQGPVSRSLEMDCQQIKTCIEICLFCLNPQRTKRPTIEKIINMLQRWETQPALYFAGP